MPAVTDSILDDIKQALGLAFDYDPFNAELILHINSVLSDLNQLGIGPDEGFQIIDSDQTWEEFIEGELRLNNVKSYMYLAVKMKYDPPTVGYVLTAMEKMLEKAEWRINVTHEEIAHPTPPDDWEPELDPFGDPIILDGNG